jgi:hypothetical protein
MDTQSIIEIIKAISGTTDSLISQIAWFFAIGAAAKWLSFTLPCLLMGSLLLRISKNLAEKAIHWKPIFSTFGWAFICVTIYTGTKGVAHLAQAAVAPSFYIAAEIGQVDELLKGLGKK